MLDISLGSRVVTPPVAPVPWDPMSQQFVEPDTTFLLDPDGDASAGLAVGQPGSIGFGGLIYCTDSLAPNVVTGRFRKGIQASGATSSYVWMPLDGILGANEFTIEFWMFCTNADLQTFSNFVYQVATGVTFQVNANRASWILTHAQNPSVIGTYTFQVQSPNLVVGTYPAATWLSAALTLKNGTLTMYLGKQGDTSITQIAQASGFVPPKAWGASSRQRGLTVGAGSSSGTRTNMIYSDLRISRYARTPGVTPSATGTSTITVANTPTGSNIIPANTVGKPITGWLGATSGQVTYPSQAAAAIVKADNAVATIRDGKMMQTTPILVGGTPDATHPTVGHSGQYCYDWTVVDRELDYIINTVGAKVYYDFCDNVQVTGGSTAPYANVVPDPITPTGAAQQPDGPNGSLNLVSATGAPTSQSFFAYGGTIWSYLGVSGNRLTGTQWRQGPKLTSIPASASVKVGDLSGKYSYKAGGAVGPPSNITNYATICADFAYHIITEKGWGSNMAFWTVWNATDQPTEWPQNNFAAYNTLFGAVVNAVHAIDPTQQIGGPEVDSIQTVLSTLFTPLLQYCVANSVPVDQVSWHDYSGGYNYTYENKIMLDQQVASTGLPNRPLVNLGELNWQSANNGTSPGAGTYPWCQPNGLSKTNNPAPVPQPGRCDYAANDFMIAYLAGIWTHYQRAGGYNALAYFTGNSTALFDQNDVPQGLYHLFKLWGMMQGKPEMTVNWVADPGMQAAAARDSGTGRVYVMVSNIHYRMLRTSYPVTVDISSFGKANGTAITAYVIDTNRSNAYDTLGASVALQTMSVPNLISGRTSFTMGPRSVVMLVIP